MKKESTPEEDQAKELENAARQHLRDKEYDEAIATYTEAIKIYESIGWKGQVGIIKKEISRIETTKKFFDDSGETGEEKSNRDIQHEKEKSANILLKKAQDAATEKQFDESIDFYNQALAIFEEYNFDYQVKKIRWEIQKIENRKAGIIDQEEVSIAEERAKRINREKEITEQKRKLQESIRARERDQEQKKQAERAALKSAGISEDEEVAVETPPKGPVKSPPKKTAESPPKETYSKAVDEKRRSQLARMKELEEKKKQQKEIEEKCFAIMDQAKSEADQNHFETARDLYQEAITYLQQINWTDQVKIIKQEITQLKVREEELAKKGELERERLETQERQFEEKVEKLQRKSEREEKEREETQHALVEKRRQKEDELYQQREEEILKEKKRLADLEEEKRLAKSPEWVKKAQLADMTLQKAEKFESAGKIPQALERYKYLLDLYNELEYDAGKIESISRKISELEGN